MQVRSVELSNFRNLKPQVVRFSSKNTVVVGANGQGKTSLIEAIYLLAQTRSFRTPRTQELVHWGGMSADVKATVKTAEGEKIIHYQILSGRKSVTINGHSVTAAEKFYGQLMAVEFTPDDLDLVKGGPNTRRAFLDKTLSMVDRSFVADLVRYNRALKSRNRILVELKAKAGGSSRAIRGSASYPVELAPWDTLLVQYGTAVLSKRARFVGRFSPIFADIFRNVVSGCGETASLSYLSELLTPDRAELEPSVYAQRFVQEFFRDLRVGTTGVGPHRDDLLIQLLPSEVLGGDATSESCAAPRRAREIASQGQARTIALALKIAAARYLHEETGEPPVLLLDDVESELDRFRRDALFELVRQSGNQVIITATAVAPELETRLGEFAILQLHEGQISEQITAQIAGG